MTNPKASELKKKFVTGATPTETDYHALINLADVGRKAVGVPEGGGRPTAGNGLNYNSDDGRLSVKLKKESGLTASSTGLEVKPGAGIQLEDNTVKLAIKAKSALSTDGGALHVKAGNGMIEQGGQLALNVNESQGLSTENGKLQVNFDPNTSGLKADDGPLAVKYDETYFTVNKDKGVTLLPDYIEELGSKYSDALKKAVSGTSNGFKKNTNEKSSELENKISEALNNAYGEGRDPMQALMELAKFFKNFREENKQKLKGSIALSPKAGDTCLYGDNVEEFGKSSLYIVDPYKREGEASNEQIIEWDPGLYGVYGLTNKDGKPWCGDGKEEGEQRWTENALMVLVGKKGNFAAVLGRWDLASDDDQWKSDIGDFSPIPTLDPKQYQDGFGQGNTKPTELQGIVADGIQCLEDARDDAGIPDLDINDKNLTKDDLGKVVAHEVWCRCFALPRLKDQYEAAQVIHAAPTGSPSTESITVEAETTDGARIGAQRQDVVTVEDRGHGVYEVHPVAIGRTALTAERHICVLGRDTTIRAALELQVEVVHPTAYIDWCAAGTVRSVGAVALGRKMSDGVGEERALTAAVDAVVFHQPAPGAPPEGIVPTIWLGFVDNGRGYGSRPVAEGEGGFEVVSAEFAGRRLTPRHGGGGGVVPDGGLNSVYVHARDAVLRGDRPRDMIEVLCVLWRGLAGVPAGELVVRLRGIRWPIRFVRV